MPARPVFTFLAPLLIFLFLAPINASRRPTEAKSRQIPQPPLERADRFGVYNWNVNDLAFPTDGSIDRLNWAAHKVAEMGSRTIRIALSARDDYRLNLPATADLAQIAQHPAYDRLFRDTRFQTYMLTAYSRGAVTDNWSDGFTQAEYNTERDEIKRLGEYLLGNSAFAGKTFIIFNWEGDNATFAHSNKRSAWDYYTDWIRARAEGVKLARQNNQSSNASLFSGLEFSAVKSMKTGLPCGAPVADPIRNDPLQNRCVIDYVAPQVEVDYYSYSSWQSLLDKQDNPNESLKQRYKNDLGFALAKVKARRPEIAEQNFIVGEFGFERARYGECHAANHLSEVFDAFDGDDAFRVSYAIFWQIIDNGRLYGLFDERFGLFRLSNGQLAPTLLSETFRKRMAGGQVAGHTGCPRIRRPPEAWGVLNQQGTTDFSLNPDSVISIYAPNCCQSTDSPFSASGNTVHLKQISQHFEAPRDNATFWYESPTQINFSIPPARRPGEAWVYVTDARGIDSNAQSIMLSCADCPQIRPSCGVLEATYQTLQIETGAVISIFGSKFSPSGNNIVIEQLQPRQVTSRRTLPRENILFESPTQINVKLPDDLPTGLQSLIYVVNQQGLESAESGLVVSAPCQDCGPRLRPCQGIVNEAGAEFFAGTVASAIGRFPTNGNKVIVEQVDQQSRAYQYTLTQGAAGWSESDKHLRFALPRALFAGRALVYAIDAQGRETRAQEITISPSPVTSVPATHFRGSVLAAESIVAAFGNAMATTTQAAQSTPLPEELAGTRVIVKDSAGAERNAPLFFVSPTQINFQVPPGTRNGAATITVFSGFGSSSTGAAQIVSVAPGLFSANAAGEGLAAAVVLRLKADGNQIYEPAAVFDQAQNRFVAVPIDLSQPGDQVFLILFGTGLRARSALSAVTAAVNGTNIEVTFAGAQGTLVGLDQINLRLTSNLAGKGESDVVVNIDGLGANVVKANFR